MIDPQSNHSGHATTPTRRVAVATAFERVEREFETFIRRKGLKLTSQRRRILKRVFATNRHFTAEEIHEAFRRGRDDVSRATVYRTLSLLVEGGFLDMLELGGDTKRYEHILGREHHDHLMCVRCGHVIEFQEERIEELQEQVAKEHGFHISSHSLRIFGNCKKCVAAGNHGAAGAAGANG